MRSASTYRTASECIDALMRSFPKTVSDDDVDENGGRCLPGPLTPGRSFAVQVYVGLTFPHVRADVPVRMTFLPLFRLCF